MRSAARLDRLGTEQAYVVLGAARALEAAGHQVVHLEIGEPDMPTPPHVVEAGVRALREGRTRYALAAGLPELRDAIAQSLAARGLRAAAENVVVAPGAKPILFCAALALVEPGDEVTTDSIRGSPSTSPSSGSRADARCTTRSTSRARSHPTLRPSPNGSRRGRARSFSTRRTTPPAAWRRPPIWRVWRSSRSDTTCGSSRTRSTGESATTAGTTPSRRYPGWPIAPSSWTASRRRTR